MLRLRSARLALLGTALLVPFPVLAQTPPSAPPTAPTAPNPPGVTLREVPTEEPLAFELAKTVIAQPAYQVVLVPLGLQATTFSFSLTSPQTTEVLLRFSDVRAMSPEMALSGGKIQLAYGALRSLTVTAFAPHDGTIEVLNTQGEVIATVRYSVQPARAFNQNLGVNYNPVTSAVGVSYSVSRAQQQPTDPRVVFNVTGGYDFSKGALNTSVGVSVNW